MRNIILEAIYLQILIVKNILFFSLSNKKSGINFGHMFNQSNRKISLYRFNYHRLCDSILALIPPLSFS